MSTSKSTYNLLNIFDEYYERLLQGSFEITDVETRLINLDKGKSMYTHKPDLVMAGNMGGTGNFYISEHSSITSTREVAYYLNEIPCFDRIQVGHNFAFDMLYLSKAEVDSPGFMIWDTMIAEYLLSNQSVRMPSLDECCELNGIADRKEDKVAKAMGNGVCPYDMDPNELRDYLKQDLEITRKVFLSQLERFYKQPKKWQNMFINQMMYRVNTFRAMANGMYVNDVLGSVRRVDLTVELGERGSDLKRRMKILSMDDDHKVDWNPSSVQHVQAVLYGGEVPYETEEVIGTYKTGKRAGQPKTKKVKSTFRVPRSPWAKHGPGTDEKTLKEISSVATGKATGQFAQDLLEYRDLSKTLNTYYIGYLAFAEADGYIHPQYNHALTPTGRLTCSKPNLQNIKGD